MAGLRRSSRKIRAHQPEDLVRLARTHFAEDFPNTESEDCPTRSTLSAIIESQALPSDELRTHLTMCSECFRYYLEVRGRQQTVKRTRVSGATSTVRIPKLVQILAGSFATILLAALISLIVNRWEGIGEREGLNSTTTKDTQALSKPTDSNPQSPMPEPSSQVSPQSESLAPRDRSSLQPLIVQNRVSIDFDADNPLRSEGPPLQVSPVLLRRTQNQLTVKLPVGSPHGRYRINLTDPYGSTVQSVEAISRDGTHLRLKLNLSSVRPGDYLICLTRESEVPQCVLSVVKPPNSKK